MPTTRDPSRVFVPPTRRRASDPNTVFITVNDPAPAVFATANGGEVAAELAAGAGSWVLPLGALAALYFFFLRK